MNKRSLRFKLRTLIAVQIFLTIAIGFWITHRDTMWYFWRVRSFVYSSYQTRVTHKYSPESGGCLHFDPDSYYKCTGLKPDAIVIWCYDWPKAKHDTGEYSSNSYYGIPYGWEVSRSWEMPCKIMIWIKSHHVYHPLRGCSAR